LNKGSPKPITVSRLADAAGKRRSVRSAAADGTIVTACARTSQQGRTAGCAGRRGARPERLAQLLDLFVDVGGAQRPRRERDGPVLLREKATQRRA
jgi:hypothetical protein